MPLQNVRYHNHYFGHPDEEVKGRYDAICFEDGRAGVYSPLYDLLIEETASFEEACMRAHELAKAYNGDSNSTHP